MQKEAAVSLFPKKQKLLPENFKRSSSSWYIQQLVTFSRLNVANIYYKIPIHNFETKIVNCRIHIREKWYSS